MPAHDVVRIVRPLDRAHDVELRLGAVMRQLVDLSMPIPCSAEIEPPIAVMRAFTSRVMAAEDCVSVGRSIPIGSRKEKWQNAVARRNDGERANELVMR